MDRSRRVIFMSHCILNQNTVVCPLARAKGAYRDIIEKIMNDRIGIHQLPCPEYRHLGLKREPMNKEQYDTKEFRGLCNGIAEDSIKIMKEYLENDYEIVGLIGINNSPTCSIKGRQGILMEEILDMVKKENISLNLIDVPGDYIDGKDNIKFIQELEEFLK